MKKTCKICIFLKALLKKTKTTLVGADVNLLPFGFEYNYELIKRIFDSSNNNTNDLTE